MQEINKFSAGERDSPPILLVGKQSFPNSGGGMFYWEVRTCGGVILSI